VIPTPALTAWRRRHPWPEMVQVEQDALLSRIAIAVADDPALGGELAWRGGTCLHKLHLPDPFRYSEDLDYVLLATARRHGAICDDIERLLRALGFDVGGRRVSSDRIVVRAATPATEPRAGAANDLITIKIEVNCAERTRADRLDQRDHRIEIGRWWSGGARVATFDDAELVGSKFRAIAQRRKGRDLFDLWAARRHLAIDDRDLADSAWWYACECAGVTPLNLTTRLRASLDDPSFVADLDPLLARPVPEYDATAFGRILIRWIDAHVVPRDAAARGGNKARRDEARWAKHGWEPGRVRCVDLNRSATQDARCPNWLDEGVHCPEHGAQPSLAGW